MTIYGWDASDYDWSRGPMDLGAARRDGIDFFTHKATEGGNVVHAHYGDALGRARAAGIPYLGAYIVCRTPGNSVSAQVDHFMNYVNAQTPWWATHPGWFFQVDLEHWGYDNVSPAVGVETCRLIRERTGRAVLLYAPQWSYADTIPGTDPLWASNYGANPAAGYHDAYPGDSSVRWASYSGRTPAILQYGSLATIGNQPGSDANAFRGTLAQFGALIGTRKVDDMLRDESIGGTGSQGMGDRDAATLLSDIWNTVMRSRTMGGGMWGDSPFMHLSSLLASVKAGDEARDAATLAAITTLADLVRAGGGNVDVATIVGAIQAAADAATLTAAVLKSDLDTALAALAAADAREVALKAKLAAAYGA